jgi:transketolase
MRDRFISELTSQAEKDQNVILIVGDLGYGVIDNFEKKFPKQFINAGVAEQNMIGMASGLARIGYKVFVYSIANFPTFRCLEQIRNDISYHNLDVSIVSIGAGFSYGALGNSHHATEDLAIMRAMPNFRIYSPCDPNMVGESFQDALNYRGPKYFRLGKSGEPIIPELSGELVSSTIDEGGENLVIVTGSIISEVILAVKALNVARKTTSILPVNLIKPLSIDPKILIKYKKIYVVEEHSVIGGLGSSVIDYLQLERIYIPVRLIAIPDQTNVVIGSQHYLRSLFQLDAVGIAETIKHGI